MLLKSQRNQLFQELTIKGLQPVDFIEMSGDGWYSINSNVESNIFFRIEQIQSKNKASKYIIRRRPGNYQTADTIHAEEATSWENGGHYDVLSPFRTWTEIVKRQTEAPDLWLEATKAVQLFESATEPNDEKFTIAELGAIHGQLRMLGLLFKDSELLQEYQTELAKLTQLAAVKAETFTKKDWQNWIKGAFISAIASLGLTEEHTQELLALVRLAFGGLFLKQ